jgi:segregation and condensation protein A
VPEMIQRLKSMLERTPRGTPLSVAEFFELQQNRRTMIAAFLAILEMVKLQAVVLFQKDAFGEILIKRHRRFEEVFASGEAMAAIEKGYS